MDGTKKNLILKWNEEQRKIEGKKFIFQLDSIYRCNLQNSSFAFAYECITGFNSSSGMHSI